MNRLTYIFFYPPSLISSPPRSDHFCLEVIWLLIIWEPVPSFTNKLSLISGNVEFQSLISRDFHLEMYYKTEKSKSYAKEAEDTFPLHKVDESLNQISGGSKYLVLCRLFQ